MDGPGLPGQINWRSSMSSTNTPRWVHCMCHCVNVCHLGFCIFCLIELQLVRTIGLWPCIYIEPCILHFSLNSAVHLATLACPHWAHERKRATRNGGEGKQSTTGMGGKRVLEPIKERPQHQMQCRQDAATSATNFTSQMDREDSSQHHIGYQQ